MVAKTSWEASRGLDPHDSADGAQDPDKDGYTNLEEYLNYRTPERDMAVKVIEPHLRAIEEELYKLLGSRFPGWEIGDGQVTRALVQARLQAAGLANERFAPLPYCDYWVLRKAAPGGA